MRALACLVGFLWVAWGNAQVRPVYTAIESHASHAKVICVGTISKIEDAVVDGYQAIKMTVAVTEMLKGDPVATVTALRVGKENAAHYDSAMRAGVDFVWFVSQDTARIDYCLEPAYSDHKFFGGLSVSMDFTVLRTRDELLSKLKKFLKENATSKRGETLLTPLPGQPLTAFVDFIVPQCAWTETLAIRMITKPDTFHFGPQKGNPNDAATPEVWKQSKEGMLRVQGLMLLRHFKSPANIRLAQRYLSDPLIAMAGEYEEPIKMHFWVRDAAYRLLRLWDIDAPPPVVFGPVIEYRIGLFSSRNFGLDRAFAP